MEKLSRVIYWCCNLVLFGTPLILVASIFDSSLFVDVVKAAMKLDIQWGTVQNAQWIVLWCFLTVFLGIGYAAVYYLRASFQSFAVGDWLSLSNGLNIRRFAKLLFAQSIATPILFTFSGLILSFNHPPGQKILAIYLGANEIKGVVVSLIFLVVNHILVIGHDIDSENKHFL